MKLSKRLNAVASMVSDGKIVADVGTDHGYIPIYLVGTGIAPKAYAMDINAGPIERAKEHIIEEGLQDKIETIRCDGMSGLKGKAVDSVIVAGMGGELVCRIIETSPVIDIIEEMILSPHSEVEKVRKCILSKGFAIVDEVMVEDYGKYYNILKVERIRGGKAEQYTAFDYLFSKKLFEKKDEIFYEYLIKCRDKYKNIIGLLEQNEKGVSARGDELKKELSDCERALQKFEQLEDV